MPESANIMLKGKKVVPLKKQRTNTSTKSYKMGGQTTVPVTSRHSNPRSTLKPNRKLKKAGSGSPTGLPQRQNKHRPMINIHEMQNTFTPVYGEDETPKLLVTELRESTTIQSDIGNEEIDEVKGQTTLPQA